MKLKDFDFRIWDKTKEAFLKQEPTLIKLYNERVIAGRISRFYANTADIADMFIGNGNDLEIELWSGMRDKNGKKIYEGDIVLIQENKEAEFFSLYLDDKHRKRDIKFLISQPFIIKLTELEPFVFDAYDIATQGIAYPLEKIRDFVFEVVGNIHENAELLKEKVLVKCKYGDMYDSKGFPKY